MYVPGQVSTSHLLRRVVRDTTYVEDDSHTLQVPLSGSKEATELFNTRHRACGITVKIMLIMSTTQGWLL